MTQNQPSLQEALDFLLDENQEVSDEILSHYTPFFSDLLPTQLKSILKVWDKVALKRRHALLSHLKKELAADLLYSFEVFGRALIHDEDAITRAFAIRLLDDCESDSLALEFLEIAENDSAFEPRAEAITALGAYIYYGEVDELLPENLKKIEDTLLEIAQSDKSTELKQRAVESLGFSSRKEVPALIEEAWKRGTTAWKGYAVLAMGRSHDKSWEEQILEALLDESEIVRLAATRAAGIMSLASARTILLTALREEKDETVLMASVWSLSEIGGEDVREYFLALIDQFDESEEEQIEYIEEALANLDFTEDIQSLDLFDFDPEG
ncbi:MAG: HEAT repeat domain-containing protein [Chloroflexi bacterium]|nr:HEAT repeat domain-containing protein [Chloroflexota bacterium]